MKTLRLPTMLAEYVGVARQCADSDAAYEVFLEHLAELEVKARGAKATERRLKQARFPVAKELSEFDFSANSVSRVDRRFWNSLGHGLRPARRMMRCTCIRRLMFMFDKR